jgi:23S rRNA (guanosine2251-2'-O)-methyltransferase
VDPSSYEVRQCRDETCRFRVPAPAASAPLACPRCGGPTASTGQLYPVRHSPGAQPAPASRVEAILDNIRSVYNVGAMLRTADGAGLSHLYLCGITATPDHPRVAKTALGAEAAVPWSAHPNSLDVADELKGRGYALWGLESGERAEPLFGAGPAPQGTPLALVVGNELAGIDPALLARCDRVLTIPMAGVKGSLNAAVAFGIAAYYLRYALVS